MTIDRYLLNWTADLCKVMSLMSRYNLKFDKLTYKTKEMTNPLNFTVLSECKTTKARVGKMILPHGEVDTPVFMPVGTQVVLYK